MSEKCEHCGSDRIYSGPPDCPGCGAPNCCQICCKMNNLEITIATLTKSLEEIAKALGITQCDPIKAESNDLFHHKGRGFLLRAEVPTRCIEIIGGITTSLEEARRFIQLVANDNLDRVSPGIKGKAQAFLSTLGGAKKGE